MKIMRLCQVLISLMLLSIFSCNEEEQPESASSVAEDESEFPLGMNDTADSEESDSSMSLDNTAVSRPVIIFPERNGDYSQNTIRSDWRVGYRGQQAFAVHRVWLSQVAPKADGGYTIKKLLINKLVSTSGKNHTARIRAYLPTLEFGKMYRFGVAKCDNVSFTRENKPRDCINPKWYAANFRIKEIQPAPKTPVLSIKAGPTAASPVVVKFKSLDSESYARTTHFEELAILSRKAKKIMTYTDRQREGDNWYPQTLRDHAVTYENSEITKNFAGDTHQLPGDTVTVSIRACSDGIYSEETPYDEPRKCSAWSSKTVTLTQAPSLRIFISGTEFGEVYYGDDSGGLQGKCSQNRCDVGLKTGYQGDIELTFEPHSKWDWSTGSGQEIQGRFNSVGGCVKTETIVTDSYTKISCRIPISTNTNPVVSVNFGPK